MVGIRWCMWRSIFSANAYMRNLWANVKAKALSSAHPKTNEVLPEKRGIAYVDTYAQSGQDCSCLLTSSVDTGEYIGCIMKTRLYNFDPLKPHFYIWKISEFFIWKISLFLVVKYSIYLNKRDFVMDPRPLRKKPIQIIENFTSKKREFSNKYSDIFYISAQNIDCWYSLEPPQRGGSSEYPFMFLSRNKK